MGWCCFHLGISVTEVRVAGFRRAKSVAAACFAWRNGPTPLRSRFGTDWADNRERHLRYFITFACYGQRVHGDVDGMVDRRQNQIGRPFVVSNRARARAERTLMDQVPYSMDGARRDAVLGAIREVCSHRG